jgi:hypothetical protein
VRDSAPNACSEAWRPALENSLDRDTGPAISHRIGYLLRTRCLGDLVRAGRYVVTAPLVEQEPEVAHGVRHLELDPLLPAALFPTTGPWSRSALAYRRFDDAFQEKMTQALRRPATA